MCLLFCTYLLIFGYKIFKLCLLRIPMAAPLLIFIAPSFMFAPRILLHFIKERLINYSKKIDGMNPQYWDWCVWGNSIISKCLSVELYIYYIAQKSSVTNADKIINEMLQWINSSLDILYMHLLNTKYLHRIDLVPFEKYRHRSWNVIHKTAWVLTELSTFLQFLNLEFGYRKAVCLRLET